MHKETSLSGFVEFFDILSRGGSRHLVHVGLKYQRNNNTNYIKNKK